MTCTQGVPRRYDINDFDRRAIPFERIRWDCDTINSQFPHDKFCPENPKGMHANDPLSLCEDFTVKEPKSVRYNIVIQYYCRERAGPQILHVE